MADTEYTRPAYTWPVKSCPCGDVQTVECQEQNCKWERDPSLVPNHLRAAIPAASLREQPEPSNDLDPRTALAYAKRMKDYCDAFNGRDWAMVMLHGSPDEQNLAHALDNLTECAAMLMNMASRVAAPSSEGDEGSLDRFIGGAAGEATYGAELPSAVDALSPTSPPNGKTADGVDASRGGERDAGGGEDRGVRMDGQGEQP